MLLPSLKFDGSAAPLSELVPLNPEDSPGQASRLSGLLRLCTRVVPIEAPEIVSNLMAAMPSAIALTSLVPLYRPRLPVTNILVSPELFKTAGNTSNNGGLAWLELLISNRNVSLAPLSSTESVWGNNGCIGTIVVEMAGPALTR